MLHYSVFAHYAQITHAVFHICDNVGGFCQNHLYAAAVYGKNKLSALVPDR